MNVGREHLEFMETALHAGNVTVRRCVFLFFVFFVLLFVLSFCLF